jgi:hypothetical protein
MSISLLSYPTILLSTEMAIYALGALPDELGHLVKVPLPHNTPNSFEHATADQHQHKAPQPPVVRLLAAAGMHPFSTGDEHTMVSTRGHSHERSFLRSQERFD